MSIGTQAIEATIALFELTGRQSIHIERESGSLRIAPVNGGFEAKLYDQGDECMISAAQWHSHFDDPEEAAWCIRWLMSPHTRIVHELKGGILACVWVERFEDFEWHPVEPAYFLNPEYPPDWKLEPDQRWFHRTICQAVTEWPRDADLPPGLTAERVTIEVVESMGLQLFAD